MGTFGFDHVHLVGSDLDASERFYRDMFGAVERRGVGRTGMIGEGHRHTMSTTCEDSWRAADWGWATTGG
jgi:catechol 2,3-dioxygenase-like lactoylglutathione lyase family enzyme